MTEPPPHPDLTPPVWARESAFPTAPEGWGWMDHKGRRTHCKSAAELIEAIRNDRSATVTLAWTPDHPYMVIPEEVEHAEEAIRLSRIRRATDDLLDGQDKIRRFGLLLAGLILYILYQGWTHAPRMATTMESALFAMRAVKHSMSVGVGLLMFLIFAFIPWYQARKQWKALQHWTPDNLEQLIPVLRFETWMNLQTAPASRVIFGLMCLAGIAQILPGESIPAAGLVKPAYLIHHEWWRLLTAPWLHGNPLHFLMNAAALLYLGKRMEVFARWPHLPLVFLFAACVGGEASARFLETTSVGASGGLMGWLGFLLVFESLHTRLVPRAATRRLLGGVMATALIGLVGYRYIDNAAHIGGMIAGMLYAGIVFPKSSSASRPGSTLTDRVAGAAAFILLTATALLAVWKVLLAWA